MVTLIYKNHLNESISFNADGLFMTDTELHDYKWDYTAANNKISYFSKGITDKKINAVIANKSRSAAVAIANKLMECAEKDVVSSKAGKLYFNDYYMTCYISASTKGQYNELKGYLEIELTITSDKPSWIKETTSNFDDSSSSGSGLDFPFDFPYNFTSSANINELNNTAYAESDFRMYIFGEVTDPVVSIGGHTYSVTGYIASGQYLIIDSQKKTVTLIKNNGEKVNWFKNRDKDSYIFEKIPSGVSAVTWTGEFKFNITIFEERSEPKWT